MKMNCHAGHSSSKASLSRFNIVSMSECDYGDWLQMEELVFVHCKLYKDKTTAMVDMSEEEINNTRRHLQSSYN
jgi:hypothetical protein